MKKKFNVIESAIKYKQITLLITAVLMIYGIYSLFVMPRQEFPDFTIRQGVIVAAMPGATSEEMENQIAQPIEDYLFTYKEVNKKKTYSQSKEGITYFFVEINDDVENPPDFWAKIKHGLNVYKAQLPDDLYDIFVNDDFGNTSAMLISLESDTKSFKELNDIMKGLEARLRQNEAVSKLNRIGMQDEVINIYLQPEKMSYYGVKPMMIMMSFQTDGAITYAGKIKDNTIEMPVHFSSKFKNIEDISEQIIFNDPIAGAVVRVKDIAYVKREMKEPDSYIINNQTKCLILSIEMLVGNNIVDFGRDVKKVIDNYEKELPADVKITRIVNQAEIVGNSIEFFLKEFAVAIFSVILVTMLLLPFRISSVAAATIPIAILISIGVMYMIGMQLDTVTLAALIAVLGMVVDNSIVIIDNYVEKLDHNFKPYEAAIGSVKELFLPVFTATLAILSCFTPIMFVMTGVGKDFIGSFPISVAIALGVSILVSALLVPYLCFTLIKKGIKIEKSPELKKKFNILDTMQTSYNYLLDKAFKFPKITIAGGVLSIVVGAVLALFADRELFPKMDRNQFAVEIYLPEGATLNKTDSIAKELEKVLLEDKRITNVCSFIGGSSPRFHTLYAPNMPSKNYAQMVVNTVSNEKTIEIIDDYYAKYANIYPEAHVKFKQIDFNPSKGPIEIRVSGDSINQIKDIAEQIAAIFRKDERVIWVRNDYLEEVQSVKFELNNVEASRLGLMNLDLSTSFIIAESGLPVTKVWEDDYSIGVQLKKQKDEIEKDFSLSDMYIPTILTSNHIPLRSIATAKPQWTEGQIVRRNGIRTIGVMVDVNRYVFASEVLEDNMKKVAELSLPSNVKLSLGGEKENEDEQYPALAGALVVGVLLVFLILLFQFKSIKTSVLIMATIPLSLLGADIGLLVMGYPFSFTAFFGIISLSGMVVRNGIILIDYAVSLLRDNPNMTVKEAAIAAGRRRLRPIFLTSAAAAVGLVPMMLSGSTLWGPFASTISFGILVSMVLTLLVLPVLYWIIYRKRDKKLNQVVLEGESI